MTKVKKNNSVDEIQEVSSVQSVVVIALDPIYNDRGQLSYGFNVVLDNVNYTFRTNQQGQLDLNNSGTFDTTFILSE